jgi:hypothetical protein
MRDCRIHDGEKPMYSAASLLLNGGPPLWPMPGALEAGWLLAVSW